MISIPRKRIGQALGMFVLALGAWLGGMAMQATMHTPVVVVCHSAQEDSTITDCDYSNGTWTPTNR